MQNGRTEKKDGSGRPIKVVLKEVNKWNYVLKTKQASEVW